LAREEATTQFRTGPLCLASFRITKKMPSAADDIVEMITARTSHTGGTLDLSESLDNLGLDSMEVVSLIFDIEEKFNIQIPINANMDIESKTLADLIHAVDRLVADKVKSN
jgi:acyl carrier protein